MPTEILINIISFVVPTDPQDFALRFLRRYLDYSDWLRSDRSRKTRFRRLFKVATSFRWYTSDMGALFLVSTNFHYLTMRMLNKRMNAHWKRDRAERRTSIKEEQGPPDSATAK
jgi:hypothetical protein